MFAKFSVQKPLTVFVSVLMVIILGFVSFSGMTPDLLPGINLPYAVVITSSPGATPEEIEEVISKPLEEQMASLENITNIDSTSSESVSMIMLEFNENANMDAVVPEIREKINGVEGAWDDTVSTPYIMKLNPDLLPVIISSMSYEGKNNVEISEFAENELMSELEGITGVASVDLSGNVTEEVNVIISQEKIDDLNSRIKESLDETFNEAEEELKEGQEELSEGIDEIEGQLDSLESAKSQIEGSQDELLNQTAQASAELVNQKIEIESGITELNTAILLAEQTLSALEQTEKIMVDAKASLDEYLNSVQTIQAEIDNLNVVKTRLDELNNQKLRLESELASTTITEEEKARLEGELQSVNTQIIAVNAELTAKGIDPLNIDAKITELESQKSTVQTSIAALNTTLAALEIDINSLDILIEETRAQKIEVEASLVTMRSTITQLETGSVGLSEAMAELNKAQSQGILGISEGLSEILTGQVALESAKAQMDSAQTELDSAEEQLEVQKEDAYEQANLEITMQMVSQLLMAQNFSMPAGFIEEDGVDYLIRVGEEAKSIEEFQNIVIMDLGEDSVGTIYLSDVAEVFLSDNSLNLYSKIDNEDSLTLSFSKQPSYATKTVADNVNAKLSEIENEYPGVSFTNLSDQGIYIDLIVDNVLINIVLGGVLAVGILILFLKDLRPTFVIACSIPISLMFAIVLMYFSGVGLNIISLSGLAVGVGMLVDNSVVVIENIYRMRSEGMNPLKAAVRGTVEVTGAIIASTLTTICVFLPIVFVQGITRQLFTDMALTVGYSLLASLIVAITLVPALASNVLKKEKQRKQGFMDKMASVYGKLAQLSLKHKWVVLSASIILLAGSAFVAVAGGFIFMPSMSGTQITGSVNLPDGATFEEKVEMAEQVYERIHDIPEIETLGVIVQAESSGSTSILSMRGGSSDISLYVVLSENAGRKDAEISKDIIDRCADLDASVSAEGSMDMSSMLSAGGSGVSVKIFGQELDNLIEEADLISEELLKVEGVDSVSTGLEDSNPEIRIVVDDEKAMEKGLTVAQVFQSIAGQVSTEMSSGSLSLEGSQKDIVIYSDEESHVSVDDIKNLSIDYSTMTGESGTVKVSEIADIVETKSFDSISRENQRRTLSVSANIKEGYNITIMTDEIRSIINNYEALPGNVIEVGGESDTIMESIEQLIYMILLGVVIIYFIMVAQFQSFKLPFIVMFTIPLAFTGGFLGLLITGHEVSVISMVGFVMLAGIIVNNGIVLIDYINHLRLEGMEKYEAIITAGKTRLRPILMTALTTVLGLVFMAVGTGIGSEMMQPIAIVCIGGLLYATLMTLFVVPAMYDILSKKKMEKRIVD